jgi:Family of unknown function (DUF6288)/HEAT repeats
MTCHPQPFCPSFRLLTVALTLLLSPALAPLWGQEVAPDLTQGGARPEGWTHDWNLGPTGARGWIHSHKLTTTHARQILVTQVEKGSPAAKGLRVGDLILGVGDKNFDGDPRLLFGRAVTVAETAAGKGRLRLRIWRKGRRKTITLRLKVLGSYAKTAPYQCEKSEWILADGYRWLATKLKKDPRDGHPITRSLNALALLASGEKKYLPLVREQAKLLSEFNQESGVRTWSFAYVNLFLAEYVLATGDERYVKKGLRRITKLIVDGQSEVGSWGHDFVRGEPLRLGGYGMMNAPGIPLTMSLVLAREAGVRVHGLDAAIRKSKDLLRFYVGKGSIPYGDHRPWIETHCDNGKNEMAAVLFDFEGEVAATEYFSRMAIAAHGAERDTGHTGNFFNLTWAMLGVARSGPAATGAWLEEYGWYFDLARRHDGSFLYQGAPTKKSEAYANWDCTGAYLLAYAQARRKCVLTGVRPSAAEPLDRPGADALIDAGRGWTNRDRNSRYAAMKTGELLDRLEAWSPVVRERAAMELGRRKKEKLVPQILKRLEAKDLATRYGACRALKFQKGRAQSAVEPLQRLLDADDLWLRILAAEALAGIGKPARVAAPRLLRMLTRRDEASQEKDPRDMERRYLTFALFDRREGLIGRSVEGIEAPLLLAAVRESLRNQDGRARGAAASVFRNLEFAQLKPIFPAIRTAIAEPSPSGIMFADTVRTAGLKLFAEHHVQEGMLMLVDYARNQKKHGSERRLKEVLAWLEGYGAHAKKVIPKLKEVADYFEGGEAHYPRRLSKEKAQWVRESIERIAASRKKPALRSL